MFWGLCFLEDRKNVSDRLFSLTPLCQQNHLQSLQISAVPLISLHDKVIRILANFCYWKTGWAKSSISNESNLESFQKCVVSVLFIPLIQLLNRLMVGISGEERLNKYNSTDTRLGKNLGQAKRAISFASQVLNFHGLCCLCPLLGGLGTCAYRGLSFGRSTAQPFRAGLELFGHGRIDETKIQAKYCPSQPLSHYFVFFNDLEQTTPFPPLALFSAGT